LRLSEHASDVVLKARPWSRFALRAALTLFWHHFQTRGLTAYADVKLKVTAC